jgi:hypothetical protein
MNNQHNKQQRQRQPATAVARGSSASIFHFVIFAIGPKGARKKRTGRRVIMPEEPGRRHRVVVVTTSYKINALRQPLLRLQRPQQTVHHPHNL